VQFIGSHRIGERLRPIEVRNAHKCVVGQAEVDAASLVKSGLCRSDSMARPNRPF